MSDLARDRDTAAALARLYDLDLLEDPGDLDLYLALASRTGGPILELAAGSGRIAVPLAEAGYEVTAVDIDPAMLDRLRERAAHASQAGSAGSGAGSVAGGARASGSTVLRVFPVEADLLELAPPAARGFSLAILALNSILLLDSRQKQRKALETMARSLAPGGLAVVDVWLPSADELSRYDGRLGLEYVRLDPETGRIVTKITSALYEPTHDRVELTSIYEESEQGGVVGRWVRQDAMRLVGPDELVEMAEVTGLEIEVLAGTYDLEPMVNHDERAILVARRRGRFRRATLV